MRVDTYDFFLVRGEVFSVSLLALFSVGRGMGMGKLMGRGGEMDLESDEDDVGFAAETDGDGTLFYGFGCVFYLEDSALGGAGVMLTMSADGDEGMYKVMASLS